MGAFPAEEDEPTSTDVLRAAMSASDLESLWLTGQRRWYSGRWLRETAGLWGPIGFSAAAAVAAKRADGYSHRADHISGLAAKGSPSAKVMVPGFAVLAAGQALMPTPSLRLKRMIRTAAATSAVAGFVQVSDRSCPLPGTDPNATVSDGGHALASVATFVLWASLPIVAAGREEHPGWYRRLARLMIAPTLAAFVTAGLTTNSGSESKGLAQRSFLAIVFAFLGATSVCRPVRGSRVEAGRASQGFVNERASGGHLQRSMRFDWSSAQRNLPCRARFTGMRVDAFGLRQRRGWAV